MIGKAEPNSPHGMAFTTTKILFFVSIVIGMSSSFIDEFRFADLDSRMAIVVLCSALYGQGLSHLLKDIRHFKSTKKWMCLYLMNR